MEKQYINTPEEMMDYLKAGETIKDAFSGFKIHMKNNSILVEGEKGVNLNGNIWFGKNAKNRYFIEREPEIEVEVGKKYKTSTGHEMFVFAFNPHLNRFLAVKVGDFNSAIYRFMRNGRQLTSWRKMRLVEEVK